MSFYNHLLADYRERFMMYTALSIIFQSCLGSIAAMLIMSNNHHLFGVIELSFCVIVTMLYNTSLMANFKKETAFKLLVISLLVNTILILINIFLR